MLAEKAQGEYCLFVDADDYIREDALAAIQKTIFRTNADCIYFGYEKLLNGQGVGRFSENAMYERETKSQFYAKVLAHTGYNSLCTKCIKRNKLIGFKAEPYKHYRIGEDLIHSIYVYKRSEKIVFIPDFFSQVINL